MKSGPGGGGGKGIGIPSATLTVTPAALNSLPTTTVIETNK